MLEMALHVLAGMHILDWSCQQRSNNSIWGMFVTNAI